MRITHDVLTALGVSAANADEHLQELSEAMEQHAIDTFLRIAHFLAQTAYESVLLSAVCENLSYSAERLRQVFPRYFRTLAIADRYAHHPEEIGSRIYGGRLGNGDEASGDGYRYRGRGFIQLTGKTNYELFTNWVKQNCVTEPDLVAERFAAHSAVFFWDTHHLNALADIDDLRGITIRINGGLNGYRGRRALLEKAKRALRGLASEASAPAASQKAAPIVMVSPKHPLQPALHPTERVIAHSLRLRRTPAAAAGNILASLAQDTPLEPISSGDTPGWTHVRTRLGGVLREGWVATRYLAPLPEGAAFALEGGVFDARRLPKARLTAIPSPDLDTRVTRSRSDCGLLSLTEEGRPRVTGVIPEERAAQLVSLIDWLGCANPEHHRYGATAEVLASTYICDYADLAGVYLPRVWWTGDTLARIALDEKVEVAFGATVRALSVNQLHDWLEDHGRGFGWQREIELIELQEAANAGEVCLIVARNRNPNHVGHLAVVVPEHEGCQAKRDRIGDVIRPAQSHAWPRPVRCAASGEDWWQNERYDSYGLWRCSVV